MAVVPGKVCWAGTRGKHPSEGGDLLLRVPGDDLLHA